MTQQLRYVGAHVSASGGLEKAVERARVIGANCMQIFSGSPRVWKRNKLSSISTEKMFSEIKKNGFGPTITHSLYLVNLATDNSELLQKSLAAIRYDLEFDALIGGGGIVVHLGSHQGRGWQAVRDQVANSIFEILAATPESSTFLIENSAGQNGKLCSNLEEIRWLMDKVNSPRLGWCFDTCHGFAAGYCLGRKQPVAPATSKSENMRAETASQAIERLDLWQSLKCIHVNDSRDPFASGKDRHENLGVGLIPPEDLKYFLNLPQLIDKPMYLEVPGMDGQGPDKINIECLRQLLIKY